MDAIRFREANIDDNTIIARHFFQLWRDNGVAEASIHSDWREITLVFIEQARQTLAYKAFIAEINSEIVASVSCQLFAGLYPHILAQQQRKYGYIWGVYVEEAYRQQGIAKRLTQMAIAYLQSLSCTSVILHASPAGKPLYSNLGFRESNEMRLDLISPS
ncbi:GNAT family N-acetyltransferase [Tolypothrix sp. FACHB-123]|uniref:GNAT family N-acetyltransferase n=1 Tax=Tolypothrix sp. FACHB-123 TaxID=2692868 RepID=UPI001687C429|nr:GNAT family N-acetyltransferase [Tolypothrix sp. FACHB-123]MBD2355214.1 GNAT family N-acetyltransferase [Tolypothrix sp. FACHB-123]